MSDPKPGRGAGLFLVVFALVGLLTGCGRGSAGIETELSRPAAPDRVPIVFIPGISREVASVLRGGFLLPPSPRLTVLTTCTGHSAYLQDPGLVAHLVQFLLG